MKLLNLSIDAAFFGLLLLSVTANGLLCFNCSWSDMSVVSSTGNEGGTRNCKTGGITPVIVRVNSNYPTSAVYCYKIKSFFNGEIYVVERGIGNREAVEKAMAAHNLASIVTVAVNGCSSYRSKGVTGDVCTCSTDQCNTGHSIIKEAAISLLLPVFILLLLFYPL